MIKTAPAKTKHMKNALKIPIIILLISSLVTGAAAAGKYDSLSVSDGDMKLVAAAIYAETEGESYLAKTCVASMIFNRLSDTVMPDTIRECVFEHGAFLRADERSIRHALREEDLSDCLILAELVFTCGIDPTCGALFCLREDDPDVSRLNVTIRVEDRVFAKP